MGVATIFYSWQSDLMAATNRTLIEEALGAAVRALAKDESIQVEPVVDRDTQGVPGSPEIHRAIFDKIEAAAVFVADVSFINQGSGTRPTPNPNVLLELGYALKALGDARVVLVLNTAYGDVKDLPFDLKMKRALTYENAPEPRARADARKQLTAKLIESLRSILVNVGKAPAVAPPAVRLEEILLDESKQVAVERMVMDETSSIRSLLDAEPVVGAWDAGEFRARAAKYEAASANLVSLFAVGGHWAPPIHEDIWPKALGRLCDLSDPNSCLVVWRDLRFYPALRVLYTGGIAATEAKKYLFLRRLLVDTKADFEGREVAAVLKINGSWCFDGNAAKAFPEMQNRPSALADHLFATLRESLRSQLPSDREYERAFDWFEAMVALVHADIGGLKRSAMPLGRLAYRSRDVFMRIQEQATAAGAAWPPLQAGLFGGDIGRFETTYETAVGYLRQRPRY